MSIKYDSNNKTFNIQTPDTSYVIGILNGTHLIHLYYGKRINRYGCITDNIDMFKGPFAFSANDVGDMPYSTNDLPMEYPTYGSGDFRTPALHIRYDDGSEITRLEYDGYEIYKGKKALNGLPATYTEAESEAESLEINLRDRMKGLRECGGLGICIGKTDSVDILCNESTAVGRILFSKALRS